MSNLPLFFQPDVQDKRVLVRVDFNVPVQNNIVIDKTRLTSVLPTLKKLIQGRAKIILLSHRGRPRGKVDSNLSLRPLVPILEEILGQPIAFCSETLGSKAQKAVCNLKPGNILLLENLRFCPGEEKNDPEFVQSLSSLGDVYINDAFAVSHRTHGSVVGISQYLPAFAGLLLEKEVTALESALCPTAQPIMAIIGGAKVSTKISLLKSLVTRVQVLVVGGGIANTFLYALNHKVGHSLCERDQVPIALNIIEQAKQSNCRLIVPYDVKTTKALRPYAKVRTSLLDEIQEGESILDIGDKTVQKVGKTLHKVKTVIWNGPVGLIEHKPFDQGSLQIAQEIGRLTKEGKLNSIAGGGETLAVINRAKVGNAFSYLSTGGGAFLEYIQGVELPGLKALNN